MVQYRLVVFVAHTVAVVGVFQHQTLGSVDYVALLWELAHLPSALLRQQYTPALDSAPPSSSSSPMLA